MRDINWYIVAYEFILPNSDIMRNDSQKEHSESSTHKNNQLYMPFIVRAIHRSLYTMCSKEVDIFEMLKILSKTY